MRVFPAMLLLASAAAVAPPPAAQAADIEARAAIVRLLEVGWSTTPQAREAADQQYEEVQRLAADDPQALAASWLVLLQQRRYPEAAKRLDEYLARQPDDPHALRAKAWTLTVLRTYPAAMQTVDKLAEVVETMPVESDAERREAVDTITFLGRLLGYFGGPVAAGISQEERKKLERQILARLEESQRVLFEDARDAVLQKYLEVSDASAEERERVASEAALNKEKTLEELSAEREEIAARERELQDRRTKLQAELRDEVAELQKEDQPLVEELARLDTRASLLRQDLARYLIEIDRLRQAAGREQNAGLRQQLLADAERLAFFSARIEADLVGVRRLGRGVQTQRAALANRQTRAQANAASQVNRIDSELADLAKRERRSEAIEKRTNRQTVGATSRSRALSATATALSTYDQLPLEAVRARLLESLR
jgi:hypothetical protein